MLRGLWSRFVSRRTEAAQEHEIERERMTPAERDSDDESFEDRQADLATEASLGGIDPDRLLPDDDPSHHH
jgi:hypothetical protein